MFRLFGFEFHLYGLLIGISIYFCAFLAQKLISQEKDFEPDIIWNALPWVIILGVIGARAYHVVHLWDYYSQNPTEIIKVWNGGIGIFGALIGGFGGILAFAKYKKITANHLTKLLDATAIVIPLGQAIGRLGNYFNQELYGKPTNLPWAIQIDPVNRLPGYESIATFHPLFFYEAFLNLVLFGLLWYFKGTQKFKIGTLKLSGVYLFGYGIIRLILEMWRIDPWQVGSLPTAQIVSALMILLGVGLITQRLNLKAVFKTILPMLLISFLAGCNSVSKQSQTDQIPSEYASQVTPLEDREYKDILVNNQNWRVEYVDSPEKSNLGLSYRSEIGADGMLFKLPKKQIATFWMKGMYMDLDMVWIDCSKEQQATRNKPQDKNNDQSDKIQIGDVVVIDSVECVVADITKNVPAPADPHDTSKLVIYSPRVPVTHVLEVES